MNDLDQQNKKSQFFDISFEDLGIVRRRRHASGGLWVLRKRQRQQLSSNCLFFLGQVGAVWLTKPS
jgi:hypothetical protein